MRFLSLFIALLVLQGCKGFYPAVNSEGDTPPSVKCTALALDTTTVVLHFQNPVPDKLLISFGGHGLRDECNIDHDYTSGAMVTVVRSDGGKTLTLIANENPGRGMPSLGILNLEIGARTVCSPTSPIAEVFSVLDYKLDSIPVTVCDSVAKAAKVEFSQ